MKPKVGMLAGGLIVLFSLTIVGFGWPWSWVEPASKDDFDQHVEEADRRFKETQDRICDKLDQIQEAIQDLHKK